MTTVAVSLKMYFSHARTVDYCRALVELTGGGVLDAGTDLVVLPDFVSVPAALHTVRNSRIHVGAQDLAGADGGAFTGEVSGAVLAEIGCTHVEVGHAERRRLFHESDEVVAAKLRAARRNGLIPILCVGEDVRTDPATAARHTARQVETAVGDADGRVLIAYEPGWAIGATRPAPGGYVAEVCAALRARFPAFAVIYGGSAGPGLLTELGDSVDGLFLGRFGHDPAAVAEVLREAAAR